MNLVQTPSSMPAGTLADLAHPRRARGLVNEVMESLATSIREGLI